MSAPVISEISAGVLLNLLDDEHFYQALKEFCTYKQDQFQRDLRSAARTGDVTAAGIADAMLTFVEDIPSSMRSIAKQYSVR